MYVEAINSNLIDEGSNLEFVGSYLILKNGKNVEKIADLSTSVIGNYDTNKLYVCSAILKPGEQVTITNSLALFSEQTYGVLIDSVTLADTIDYKPSWNNQHGETDNTWYETDVLDWSSLTNDKYDMVDGIIDHPMDDFNMDDSNVVSVSYNDSWHDVDIYQPHSGAIISPSLKQKVLNYSLNNVILRIIKISK